MAAYFAFLIVRFNLNICPGGGGGLLVMLQMALKGKGQLHHILGEADIVRRNDNIRQSP